MSLPGLKNLTKPKLLEAALEMQKTINGYEVKEDEEMNSKYSEILKKIQDLEEWLASTEDKLYQAEVTINKNCQYSRRENIERSGIPEQIQQTELENTVINILQSINVTWARRKINILQIRL